MTLWHTYLLTVGSCQCKLFRPKKYTILSVIHAVSGVVVTVVCGSGVVSGIQEGTGLMGRLSSGVRECVRVLYTSLVLP